MSAPKWHEGRLVAFDVESTGTEVFGDRIITAAIVHTAPNERPRTLTWVIDPQIEVPAEAAAVHGWTRDRIRTHIGDPASHAARTTNGHTSPLPSADQAFYEIAGQIALAMSQGVPVVAANAAFDLTMLEAENTRHGVDTLAARLAPGGVRGVVDPMILDKQRDPYRKVKGGCRCGCGATDKTLTGLCKHYGVLLAGAHDASADALAALRLAVRLAGEWPEIARWKLDTLHKHQIEWRRDQMKSLRAYFDRNGTEHDGCCGEWPLHTSCAPSREAVA